MSRPLTLRNQSTSVERGDSFAAGMALALYATGDIERAVLFGNLVSSVTIMKEGTGVAAPSEVLTKANSLAK